MSYNIFTKNYSRTETHKLLQYFFKKKKFPISENLIYEWNLMEIENESLFGVGKFLSSLGFKIDGFRVKSIEELFNHKDIFSCIVENNKTILILIIEVEKNSVKYFHPSKGIIKDSLHIFKEKWESIIITSEIDSDKYKYINKNLRKKQKGEVKFNLLVRIFISLIVLLQFYALFYYKNLSLITIFLYFISYTGIYISLYLINTNSFRNYRLSNKLCSLTKLFNCNIYGDLNYPQWLKKINFSILSLSYFIGLFIFLSLKYLFNLYIFYNFFYFFCAIAFTCFSLFVQVFLIKKICPFCFILTIFVWASFLLINIKFNFSFNYLIHNTLIYFISFVISYLYYLYIVYKSKSEKLIIRNSEIKFNNIEIINYNYRISQKFILNEPYLNYLGYAKAPNIISVIVSPFCILCKQIILKSLSLIEKNIDYKLRIIICPNRNLSSKQQKKYDSLFWAIYSDNVNNVLLIKKWCKNNNEKIIIRKDNNSHKDKLAKIEMSNFEICTDNNIDRVPLVIVNNRLLPSEYSVEDIPFYVNNIEVE